VLPCQRGIDPVYNLMVDSGRIPRTGRPAFLAKHES
jgi:hypothetical protein